MKLRDWAGTIVIAASFGLAALLRDSVAAVLLLVVALVAIVAIVVDVRRHPRNTPGIDKELDESLIAVESPALVEGPVLDEGPSLREGSALVDGKPPVRQTPRELVAFYEGQTEAQAKKLVAPFIGQWMRVFGRLADVGEWTNWGCYVFLEPVSRYEDPTIAFVFTDESWRPQLETLRPGDEVTIVGEIHKIDRSNIRLDDCRLE